MCCRRVAMTWQRWRVCGTMFRTKVRLHTCKVILATSLVWFLVDVVVLTFYSDCAGWGCVSETPAIPTPQALVPPSSPSETATSSKGRGNLHELMRDRGKKTYSPWELMKWKPAPTVKEQVMCYSRCSLYLYCDMNLLQMLQPLRIDLWNYYVNLLVNCYVGSL